MIEAAPRRYRKRLLTPEQLNQKAEAYLEKRRLLEERRKATFERRVAKLEQNRNTKRGPGGKFVPRDPNKPTATARRKKIYNMTEIKKLLSITGELKLKLQELDYDTGKVIATALAEVLIDKALAGDLEALKEILNRTDGKVVERHEIDNKNPVTLVFKPAFEQRVELETSTQGFIEGQSTELPALSAPALNPVDAPSDAPQAQGTDFKTPPDN